MTPTPQDFCLSIVSKPGRGWPGDLDNRVLCECAHYIAQSAYADRIDPAVLQSCELPRKPA
ncbi:MAG: hypothetical protein AAGJ86_09495 [Pseudomonadota bacterium]